MEPGIRVIAQIVRLNVRGVFCVGVSHLEVLDTCQLIIVRLLLRNNPLLLLGIHSHTSQ